MCRGIGMKQGKEEASHMQGTLQYRLHRLFMQHAKRFTSLLVRSMVVLLVWHSLFWDTQRTVHHLAYNQSTWAKETTPAYSI